MPELPEVETVRRGLAPVMEGAVITRADVNREGLRWPFPPDMAARLSGQKVLGLRRRSKYILVDLESGETLLIHLGMSGRMLISGDSSNGSSAPGNTGQFVHNHPATEKHDHVVLHMEHGARITFNDPRRFGAMDLFATVGAADHALLAKLGPEPLGNHFDEGYLASALAGRNTPIKSALLDQRLVAGLGNIYVCETLFRAGISPRRKAGHISARRTAALVPIIRDVLRDAIEAGGSSLRDFRQADGELGYFQHSFDVYGREGQPCRREGCDGVVGRIVQAGRSSFYCGRCQR
ncbi:bifunctional DNA-formamidopyrimidine glycosylase/DNA-(apurinic or apyrimidinic site) lyase [Roseovarius sp. Pro17]|uniref:bifunctional DNA-formamidopyrimidine glycosylase/DNA-(apurinic or apyrimidinic site) lyase n=1 Tax=Roseovarius sp. Pro17 TaxID=3108175 RepID=UPI002D765E48|nr:bifunctional DNA-formamidopyrimidine glycosylase/DNA-(apurinic or apyrimidinic site) lyase [Roseovarius sp. Pro17]